MFQDLLNEWIRYWENKYSQKVDMSQMFYAINFATWLESRRPSTRAADQHEQEFPDGSICASCGQPYEVHEKGQFVAHKSEIPTRSVGG